MLTTKNAGEIGIASKIHRSFPSPKRSLRRILPFFISLSDAESRAHLDPNLGLRRFLNIRFDLRFDDLRDRVKRRASKIKPTGHV